MSFYNHHIGQTLDEFVMSNQKMVKGITGRVYGRKLSSMIDSFEDLMQVGNIGLIKAYQQFDPEKSNKKIKPSSYAFTKIVSEIGTYIKDKGCSIRYPREFFSVWNFYRNSDILDETDYARIASEGGFKLSLVERCMPYYEKNPLSLNFKINVKGEEMDIIDTIHNHKEDFTVYYYNEFKSGLDSTDQLILDGLCDGFTFVWFEKNFGMKKNDFYKRKKSLKQKLETYMEVV